MKNYLISLVAVVSGFAVVACSNGGGGSGSAPTPVCPLTHSYDAGSNTCVPIQAVPTPTPVPSVAQYYDYNRHVQQVPYYPYTQVTNGDMQIVNSAAYKSFLKEALAICDRNIWGGNYGLDDCNSWVGGSFQVSWRMDSSMIPVVKFEAQVPQNAFQWAFSWGFDGGGYAFNPLTLSQNNTFSLINNSKGYEIRANGSHWNGGGLRLIQIQVHAGTLADNTVAYELYYPHNNQPTLVAKGKFKRY